MSQVSLGGAPSEVGEYYRSKTDRLLDKYGPGPRVHYHIGCFEPEERDAFDSVDEIRERIVRGQVALVDRAARFWWAETTLSGRVLDIGCGLGGGALYWAERFGARVTALTLVEEHAALVGRFAAEIGVGRQIATAVCDAAHPPALGMFDGAVAMESMCYMDRRAVFAAVARMLPPGGEFCVQDVFVRDRALKSTFDHYWRTDVGTVEEYVADAESAGFALVAEADLTSLTTDFWLHSMAWAEARIAQLPSGDSWHQHLVGSIRHHALFFRAWRQGAFGIQLLRFARQR